jgi:lipocalin-like protein
MIVGRLAMRKAVMRPAAVVASVVVLAAPAATQDTASQLVGIWKLQRFDRCIAGGACEATFGEAPVGYSVYTKTGLLMTQGYYTKRVLPKTPDPTDAERIELFKSMYAYGGRYKVEGDKLTIDVEFAWTEAWKGQPRTSTFNLNGKMLTVESSPFKSPLDGKLIFTRVVFERVE